MTTPNLVSGWHAEGALRVLWCSQTPPMMNPPCQTSLPGEDADASSSRDLEEEERQARLEAERRSKFNDECASR
jgi:hypothetical protein